MFTGIVEETGTVERIKPAAKSIELTIRANLTGRGLKVGDSLAINGWWLTGVQGSSRGKSKLVQCDLLREPWDLTNLQFILTRCLVFLTFSRSADGPSCLCF